MPEHPPPEWPPEDQRAADAPAGDSDTPSADYPDLDGNRAPGEAPPAVPLSYAPFARPADAPAWSGLHVPYARGLASALQLPNISGRRAVLEILAVVGGTFVSSLFIANSLAILLFTTEQQQLSIPSTLVLGVIMIWVCLVLLWEQGQSLRSIGLATSNFGLDIAIGCGAYVATAILLLVMMLSLYVLLPEQVAKSQEETAQALQDVFPKLHVGLMILFMGFVAFWEEIVFRGFLLTRLQVLLRRWWLTVPVGAMLFGLGHFWQGGFLGILKTTLLGLAIGALFAWRKSLVPGIVFHVLNNVVALLLLNAVT